MENVTQKPIVDKLKKVSLEIFVIVFSILLSTWFQNWSDDRKDAKEAKEFLTDLNVDLKSDLESLTEERTKIESAVTALETISKLTEKQLDSIGSITFSMRMNKRMTNNGNFEGFKSSGKLGFIESKGIKKQILAYYQESVPALEYLEAMYLRRKSDFLENDATGAYKTAKSRLPSIQIMYQLAQALKEAYDYNINQIDEIVKEIEKTNK